MAVKMRRLRQLSGWQWRVLLSAPFVLLLTWLRLCTGGYGKTLAAVRPSNACHAPADEQLNLARDTAYALAVATRYGPWRPRCLLRSLALGWFLGRKGIAFEVRIGVPGGKPLISARGKPEFAAHAWVECNGIVLNEREDIALEFLPFDL